MAPSTPPPPSTPAPSASLPAAPPRPPGDGVDPTADRMLAAARQGSNKAWAALVERVDPECRRLAHLVLGGHDVDRALLSAYVRAYRARRKGPSDAVVFLTHHVWIACGHEIRRHQRREAPAPGRRAVHTDRRPRLGSDALGRAVAGLRPEERAIWALVDEAGFPVGAVASALGVDAKVVTTVASRVARLLDEALEEPTSAVEVLGEDAEDRPDLGTPGDDTSAVMATEPSTVEVAPTDADDDEPEDAGQLEPDPATPGFWRELGRRLQAERQAPRAAPPPPLPEPGELSPALAAAKAPPVAMQKRAPKKSRRGRRPDVVEGLAGEVDRQRPRRSWAGMLVKGAAILVVLGVLGATLTALYLAASKAESPVKGQTVADVTAASMEVLGEATWSASIERETLATEGIERASLKVSTSPDGSFRVEDASVGRLTTYDAATGTLQDVIPGFPPRNELGVALGAPMGGPPREGTPLDDLGIAARTLAAVDDEPPVEATLNGRDVYRLTGPLTDEIDLTYTVDAGDLFPVRITWTVDDQQVRELRFADVLLDGVPGPYGQELPAGTPTAANLGFVPVGITEVSARTDLAPLTPEFLPDGFVSAGVAVNETDRIAQLRYARGPQELLITLRPSPVEAGQPWDDPFTRVEGQVAEPTDIALDAGPFRGTTAQQVAGPQALPSLWAADGELAFTVSGDVTADELVRIARSLRTT